MDDRWPSFRLLPQVRDPLRIDGVTVKDIRQFSEYLLNRQVRWFIRLRWAVVVVLLFADLGAWLNWPILGALNSVAGTLAGLAGLLLIANIGFHMHCARGKTRSLLWELWIQIVVDLLAIGVVVIAMGGVTSYAPFLYIPHIVLACLFFKHQHSRNVLLLSLLSYLGCLSVQIGMGGLRVGLKLDTDGFLFQVGLACFILCVTWYLGSKLSKEIRQRDKDLANSHALLISSFKDHRKRVLQIAHQMKTPVASIRTCTNLYRFQHPEMPTDLVDSFDKIDSRCDAVLAEIGDMLFLASVRGPEGALEMKPVDMKTIIEECVSNLDITVKSRGMELICEGDKCEVMAVHSALKKLIDNLLTNAVNYSFDSGNVEVKWHDSESGPILVVRDNGIGIPEAKLPNIFDEYYRTSQAQKHCRLSTGLGLSIVREVAALHGVVVTISSREGEGTEFCLQFPATNRAMPGPSGAASCNGLESSSVPRVVEM